MSEYLQHIVWILGTTFGLSQGKRRHTVQLNIKIFKTQMYKITIMLLSSKCSFIVADEAI